MTSTELANYGTNLPTISVPIASNGSKRPPIEGSSDSTDVQASIKYGLPYLMSQPLSSNGIPVPRQDVNGLFNLLSRFIHFIMAGGVVPWLSGEKNAIQGYAQGAIVYDPATGSKYQSLSDGNQSALSDTTKWKNIDPLLLTGGNVSGSLKVQNNEVVRSVNGNTADANGNVAVSVSALSNSSTFQVYKNDSFPTGATSITTEGVLFTMSHDGNLIIMCNGRGDNFCYELYCYLGSNASGELIAYFDPDYSSASTTCIPVKQGTNIFVKLGGDAQQAKPSVKILLAY